jgi:4-hydroxy-tetrahydrodipicolinate reductase
MSSRTDVAICGLGPIGRGIAAVAAAKRSLRLVGALDVSPDLVGRQLADFVPGADAGIAVAGSLAEMLARSTPQVVLHATGSYLVQVYPQFEAMLEAGLSVVSTCEETSYPLGGTALAAVASLDALCRRRGARLLSTGINPGFAMDVWPLLATAAHTGWQRIRVTRILDASKRREPLQRKVGAGMTPEEFRQAASVGAIGHVGLPASANMLARGLGRRIARSRATLDPVLASEEVSSQYFRVAAGKVAGIRQGMACDLEGGGEIMLHLEMYLGAPNPYDEVLIEGGMPTRILVSGGFSGDTATAALITNTVAPLLTCAPGYHTMLDLPLFGCAP